MKICHLTSVHDSLDDRIFLKEAVSAQKEGYQTYIVSKGKSFIQDNVHIVGIGCQHVTRLQRMIVVTRKIYNMALKIDADIYQFHDPELMPFAIKLKKKGKKVIYDSHEDVPRQIMAKDWLPVNLRRIISNCYEKYEKHMAKKLDTVITATPHIANVFTQYGSDTVTIRNYPILTDIKGENGNYLNRKNVLCYAGGLTVERGITQLVKTVEMLDAKLILAGDIEQGYKELLMKEAGWNKVELAGFLDRTEVNQLYDKSRIGMAVLLRTPNHVNALAIKLFEYMAAGIPIICSDFSLWKEIVEENHCGICVDPENIIQIKKAIQYLLDNPQEAKKMGDNGKAIVFEKYNWDKEKTFLLSLYSDMERPGEQLV